MYQSIHDQLVALENWLIHETDLISATASQSTMPHPPVKHNGPNETTFLSDVEYDVTSSSAPLCMDTFIH